MTDSELPDFEKDGPAWAVGFDFGASEMVVTALYTPRSWEDAVEFLSTITGFGAELENVEVG